MTAVHFQVLLFLGAGLYLLPALIAVCRGHRHQWAIVGLDLILGWTGIGWVAALIWARTTPTRRPKRSSGHLRAGRTFERARENGRQTGLTWDDASGRTDAYASWLESGEILDQVDRRFAIRLVKISGDRSLMDRAAAPDRRAA